MFPEGFWLSTPTPYQLWWAALFAFGVLLLAVAMELARRQREKGLRRQAEWRSVEQIIREKELSEREARFLKTFIKNYAPKTPLKVATTRLVFDDCVSQDIADAEALDDPAIVEEHGAVLRDIRKALGLDYIPFGQRIHSTRELYERQLIWAADATEGREEWTRLSVTSVDEAHVRAEPLDKQVRFKVRAGMELQCRMWREEDARYVFRARLERIEAKPELWVLRHARDFQRQQSRAHFRIPYDAAAEVELVDAPVHGPLEDAAERPPFARIRGRFGNLSAGGFSIIVSQPVVHQVLVRVEIDLGSEEKAVQAMGRVVGTAALSAGRHLVRASFIGMTDETRERISRFVFHKQKLRTVWSPGRGILSE